jgi:hypothetical protein
MNFSVAKEDFCLYIVECFCSSEFYLRKSGILLSVKIFLCELIFYRGGLLYVDELVLIVLYTTSDMFGSSILESSL